MRYDKKDTPIYRGLVAVFKGLGGTILLVLATYALSAWYLDTFRDKAEYVVSAEELIEKFDLTVFRKDDAYPDAHVPLRFARKWVKSIAVSLENENAEMERAFLEDLCALLTNLTGLKIRLDKGAETITVDIANDSDDFKRVFNRIVGDDPRITTRGVCVPYGWPGRTTLAHVIVLKYDDPSITRHLLLTEITQCLGPGGDFGSLQPSVFSISGPSYTKLPLNDQIILRTLYDRRIEPGMSRDEALKIAAEIIPVLLKRLQEMGPEGLYQPVSQ